MFHMQTIFWMSMMDGCKMEATGKSTLKHASAGIPLTPGPVDNHQLDQNLLVRASMPWMSTLAYTVNQKLV